MDLSVNGEGNSIVASDGEAEDAPDNSSLVGCEDDSDDGDAKPDISFDTIDDEDAKPDVSSDTIDEDHNACKATGATAGASKPRRRQRKNFPVPSSSRVLRSQSPVHESTEHEERLLDCKKEKRSATQRNMSNDENEQAQLQVSKSKRKSTKPRKLKIVISKKNPSEISEGVAEEGQAHGSIKVERDDVAEEELMEAFSSASDQEYDIVMDNSSDEDYVENAKAKAAKVRPKKGKRASTAAEPSGTKKVRKKKKRDSEVSECKVCLRTFRNFYMPTHMRTHTGEKPYACNFCTKQFSTECYLKMHKQSCHEDPQAFQCNICQRNLASKGSLREHKRTHSDERPFQCHICQKVFRQPALLINHVKTHSDLTPYQCELCGNRYKYKRSMEMHKERIHDGIRKSFPCTICTKVFTRKTKLKDHTNWHLGKSPHLCEHCGKRFLSRKTLRTHLLIHEDKKPYPCDMCGKAFRQAHVLKRHVTTHTGIKPFKCDLCSKQFIHRVYLVRHDCPKKSKILLPLPEKLEMVEEEVLPMEDTPLAEETIAMDMTPITIQVPMSIQESI